MLRMWLYLIVIINIPVLRFLGYPHLYCQRAYVEIRKLFKCILGESNVLGSFGAPGARVNNSDKDTFHLSDIAHCHD